MPTGREEVVLIKYNVVYKLADRLLLLKCYDRKMVKLPGCLFCRGALMKLTNKKIGVNLI